MKLFKKLLSVNSAVLVLCALPVFLASGLLADCFTTAPPNIKTTTTKTPHMIAWDCSPHYDVNGSNDDVYQWTNQGGYKICKFTAMVYVIVDDVTCCVFWACWCGDTAGLCEAEGVTGPCGHLSTWAYTQHTSHGCTEAEYSGITLFAPSGTSCGCNSSEAQAIWTFEHYDSTC